MTRSNFSVQLRGIMNYRDLSVAGDGQNFTVGSEQASETTSGTSRRKPAGWLLPTPYNFQTLHYQCGRGVAEIRRPALNSTGFSGYRYSGVICSTDSSVPYNLETLCTNALNGGAWLDLSGLSNTALIRARSALKGMSVDLGTAFGERNQTARLIGDTATRLAKAARSLRHGRFRDAARQLGVLHRAREPRGSNLTQKWLELQYGWKPLLSDVYGACDALRKRDTSDWRVTAKGRVKEIIYGSKVVFPATSDPTGYSSSGRIERGAFCRIDAIPTGSPLGALSSVGVTNPLNVAWELVPFSFVADWLIPIGGWLESLDATIGFSEPVTSISTLFRGRWTVRGVSGRLLPPYVSSAYEVTNTFEGSKNQVLVVRSVSAGVPAPRFPGFKDPRSFGHMANGLALLAQVFAKR